MQVSFLFGCRIADCDVFGGARDLLQSRAEKHRLFDLSFKLPVEPGATRARDGALIVHLIFKYLETLGVGFRDRPDTGDLFARSRR